MDSGSTITIAILTSIVASVIYGIFNLMWRGVANWRRAKPFVGKYAMEDADGKARGGTVTLEYKFLSWTTFLNAIVVLRVFAEHGTGPKPGTEDWSGQAEVFGVSDVAVGFYSYRDRSGGALRLHLSRDGESLTEYGFPNTPSDTPFMRVLRRVRGR